MLLTRDTAHCPSTQDRLQRKVDALAHELDVQMGAAHEAAGNELWSVACDRYHLARDAASRLSSALDDLAYLMER